MQNINNIQRIIDDPETALGSCTSEQLVDAAASLLGWLLPDALASLADQLARDDETTYEGLLSALENVQ